MVNVTAVSLAVIWFVSYVDCSKILGVFPSPGYSQFILCEGMMKELALRGHEVTVISPFKPKDEMKNYRTILIKEIFASEMLQGSPYDYEPNNVFFNIIHTQEFALFFTEFLLSHPHTQKLIHSNETFDLVIVEDLYNEAHFGFAAHFRAPLVLFSSIGPNEWNSHLAGNIFLPSVIPVMYSSYTIKMSFYQRLWNTLYTFCDYASRRLMSFPLQQQYLNKYFPGNITLEEVAYNASLMLLNSHPVVNEPTWTSASMKEIGGFHIKTKPLPSDIRNFLDNSKHGAIYFSMGTNLPSANISNNKIMAILNVIRRLEQNVLWKFEDESLIQDKPKNLLISKWLPQSDILQHPNTILFISHGGFLSATETVYAGVPVIGIPIFFDQKMNVAKMERQGFCVHLPFRDISEELLHEKIMEVIKNPRYRENVQRRSKMFKDNLADPLGTAMYWIEFVLRYQGSPHLRNSSYDLNWFQLYLLDVVGLIIVSFIATVYILKLVFIKFYIWMLRYDKSKTE